MSPIRVTVVLTHPIQYFSPWFRQIATEATDVALTVLYVTAPSAEQRGAGFGRPVEWGTPLMDGYQSKVIRAASPSDSVATGSFWSLDSPEIGREIAATRPDVVVVPGWQCAAYVRAILACRRRGIPVLYRGDSHLGNAPAGLAKLAWRVKNWIALRLFDGYLTVGTRSREYLADHGIGVSSTFPSPHAVDNDFFAAQAAIDQAPVARRSARVAAGIDPGAFVVLIAGKLTANKRPLDVVRAAAGVGDIAVAVVGDGALGDAVAAEARRLNVPIARLGFADQPGMARAYAIADCLVVPSESETWGFVVNEALATGLPCVISDGVGCAPDLIGQSDARAIAAGETFRTGDVDDCARAIRAVRERMQAHGTEVAAACRAAVARNRFADATAGLAAAARYFSLPGRRKDAPEARVLVCGGGLVTFGGAERMLFEIIRVCREGGASVHVTVNDWGSASVIKALDSIGVTWSYVWLQASLRRSLITPLGVLRYAREFWRSSADLLAAAARVQPTRVLVLDYTAALRNCFALLALRIGGVPVLMKLQNAPESGRFYRRLMRWLVNPLVTTFVSNSEFTERQLLASGIPRRKSVVIYNTLPTRPADDQLPVTRQPGRIVYVGQIIPEKGIDRLLDAMEMLLARGKKVSLDVVGTIDGWGTPDLVAFRSRVRERVAAAPLRDAVRLLGYQEHIFQYLQSASIHCCPSLPSIREAFGLVVLEAKHAGLPSVVFNSGALPELVKHRIDGWICPEPTAAALADGLSYFLDHPDECASAGQCAADSAARFDRATFARLWWSLVSERRAAIAEPVPHAEVL